MFATPKRHILLQNRVFWRILRQNPSRGLAVASCKNPPPPKKKQPNTFWCAIWRMRGNETPGWIVTSFCTGVGLLSVMWGQILGFCIDLHRPPYYILALPCECVILFYFICYRVMVNKVIIIYVQCRCRHRKRYQLRARPSTGSSRSMTSRRHCGDHVTKMAAAL